MNEQIQACGTEKHSKAKILPTCFSGFLLCFGVLYPFSRSNQNAFEESIAHSDQRKV